MVISFTAAKLGGYEWSEIVGPSLALSAMVVDPKLFDESPQKLGVLGKPPPMRLAPAPSAKQWGGRISAWPKKP